MTSPPVTTHLFDTMDGTVVVAGTAIFIEGDRADCFYVLKHGSAEVQSGGRAVATVGAGEILGEMALISDDGVRGGTAVALVDCEVIAVDRARFEFLVTEHPMFALTVLRTLARRLQLANGQAV